MIAEPDIWDTVHLHNILFKTEFKKDVPSLTASQLNLGNWAIKNEMIGVTPYLLYFGDETNPFGFVFKRRDIINDNNVILSVVFRDDIDQEQVLDDFIYDFLFQQDSFENLSFRPLEGQEQMFIRVGLQPSEFVQGDYTININNK